MKTKNVFKLTLCITKKRWFFEKRKPDDEKDISIAYFDDESHVIDTLSNLNKSANSGVNRTKYHTIEFYQDDSDMFYLYMNTDHEYINYYYTKVDTDKETFNKPLDHNQVELLLQLSDDK